MEAPVPRASWKVSRRAVSRAALLRCSRFSGFSVFVSGSVMVVGLLHRRWSGPGFGFAPELPLGGRAGSGWAAGQGEGEPGRLAARLGPDTAGRGKGGDDRQAPAAFVTRDGLAGP